MDRVADVIVIGARLAGLSAAAELAESGSHVIIIDQVSEANLGRQTFWSIGGLFFANTPERRRLGTRDSYEPALQDWMGSAGFDRPEDNWPRRWAEAYLPLQPVRRPPDSSLRDCGFFHSILTRKTLGGLETD